MRKQRQNKLICGTVVLAALAAYLPLGVYAEPVKSSPTRNVQSSFNKQTSENASSKVDAKTPIKKPYRRNPKDKLLNDVYSQLVAYRPDRALSSASRLICTIAQKDLKNPKTRLLLSRALLWVAFAYQMDENLPAARSAFLTAHQLVPDDLIATCYLANCEREMHHYEAERALIDSLYKASDDTRNSGPDDSDLRPKLWKNNTEGRIELKMLARSARRKIDLKTAMARFAEAELLDTDNKDTALQILIAQASVLGGLGEPAAKRFERAAELTENDYTRELLLADAASVRMNQADQEEHLLNASRIYSYDPIWRVKLANLYHGASRDAEARKLLEEAIDCKRLSSNAYLSLAQLLSSTGKYDEALQVLDHIEKMTVPSPAIALARADVYRAKNDSSKALKFYDEALKLNDRFSRPYENSANIYTNLNKNDDALKVMSSCIKTIPNYWRAHLTFASTIYSAGKLDDAVAESKKGLSLLRHPDSDLNVLAKHYCAKAHAIIGYSLYKNKQWDEALKEAKEFNRLKFSPELPPLLKVVNIRPARLIFTDELGLKDPMSRAALGDLLFELRDLTASEQEYRKAIELLPDNRDLHGYLLHVLTQKGDWGEAAKQNLVLSSKIVNGIPRQVGSWGSKKSEP